MGELKVKNVIIGKQFENSENYQEFLKIVKENKIKVHIVEAGYKIQIEENLYFNVLWPIDNNIISDNLLNNNSLVCKLIYKDFSIMFTGDIEEMAEKEILKMYKNNFGILRSNVLKVAHHGSKTSTTEEFLKAINPQIALIGVGKDNTFGHPNGDILERMQNLRCENL